MANQGRLLQPMLGDELDDIGCHGCVVMSVIVRRLAVVTEILSTG